MINSLSLVVHGESGVGKSWLGDTAPKPALVLDAEGGSRFTQSRKTFWDGRSEPPQPDGTWDTCIVTTRSFPQVAQVYQWLASGRHGFRSVVLDSLTEIQKRCLDDVAGVEQPTTQDWGALLRRMEMLVRQFRDLTMHPTRPLEAVVLICMTSEKGARFRPHVQGQLGITLPYFVDVVGYLFVQPDETGQLQRRLLVQPAGQFDAKDRTNRLGQVVEDPNVEQMIAQIYGVPQPAAAPAPGPQVGDTMTAEDGQTYQLVQGADGALAWVPVAAA